MGAVTAEALAAAGASVAVVGRGSDGGATAVERITARTGNPNVEFLRADLSSQAEVRYLAEKFRERHSSLHVLVNNAGATFASRHETGNQLEMTFAVNYLAAFLLSNLVLDLLKDSAPARIVNVSSRRHRGARVNFEDLQSREHYSGVGAYAEAKLCTLLFTYELARRLKDCRVTVNALHPGFVGTHFGEQANGLMGLVLRLAHRVALSPEKGAQTIIYLASSPEVEGMTGQYFYQQRAIRSSPESYDVAAACQLWEVSCSLTGLPSA